MHVHVCKDFLLVVKRLNKPLDINKGLRLDSWDIYIFF